MIRRRVVDPRARARRVLPRHGAAERRERRRDGGWVRNTRDGTVEAVFEGAESVVEALVAFCHVGPRGARVERVEVSDEPVEGIGGFAIR